MTLGVAGLLLLGLSAPAQSPSFRYFYDDTHRLFRVLDSTGNLLEYDYDRSGNILGTQRSTVVPNTLAVLNMTPILTGPGHTITIYGQNFSPNGAGAIVSVNGVAATVLSATATTLVVQLGAGTTSGPVSVTVNGVTATSGTLQLSATIPNITSVTPDDAPLGSSTTIALTGSHLTGASFSFAGGAIAGVSVVDDSNAILQITAVTLGNFPIIATTSSGSSPSTPSIANEFVILPQHGSVVGIASLLNNAWIPSDLPASGNLTKNATLSSIVSLLNNAWVPSDLPASGNLTKNATLSSIVSLLNNAWVPSDLPASGNLTKNATLSGIISVLNQGWISSDLPASGNLKVAAGLLISVDNTAMTGTMSFYPPFDTKMIGAGSSNLPVDFSSVNDGDAMIAGETVRFRVRPPQESLAGSDFLLNGTPLRIHAPFDVLVTAPIGIPAFDLQAVVYAGDGRVWRTSSRHLQVLPDPGFLLTGHALRDDGSPAAGAVVNVQVNGLTAEYFRADSVPISWPDLEREPDKRGFVSAINQPNPAFVFGTDPFGTGFASSYTDHYRGTILVATAGEHRFFLEANAGARLTIDGHMLIDTPIGQPSPEPEAAIALAAGWHTLELRSYHTASNPRLQLSWQPPNSDRQIVRPEALATGLGQDAPADWNGSFRLGPFPAFLNPLGAYTVPLDPHVHTVLDINPSTERLPR